MSNKQPAPSWVYTLLGATVGALVTFAYYDRQESIIDARWQAVTGTTIEEAEQRVKACQPCSGVLATHRGKR